MERGMRSGLLALALALVGLSMQWTGSASAASPLWTFPFAENAYRMTIAPSGTILDGACTDIHPDDGSELWTLPTQAPSFQQCEEAISDSAGNLYVYRGNTKEEGQVESYGPTGTLRWATPTGSYVPFNTKDSSPALGANGDVYFVSYNGFTTKLIGFNEATGGITLEHGFLDAQGVSADNGGLVVFDEADYTYLGYDGSVQHTYPIADIAGNDAYSSAFGADGDAFSAGYSGTCGSDAHASVEKFTPSGLAWTWTSPDVSDCGQTGLAATPDGGAILGRDEGQAAMYTSIGPDGHERWSQALTGGVAGRNAGYLPISVDVNGTVGLPADIEFVCTSPSGYCQGAQVKYVSEATGATVLPELRVSGSTSESGFSPYWHAAVTGRTYLSGYFYQVEGQSQGEPIIAAFDKPGLAKSYPLFLQEEVTKTGPPVPPPPPPPTLPVTVADGGGGGVAGGPDPGPNIPQGPCDPGANTNWLHIAKVTFTCIVSGDVWDDPTLLSAKKKCIINIASDVLPFAKLLRAPKYIKEADSVEAAIRLAAKETAGASYPGKATGDAKAVAGLQTTLEAIKNPKQALLTILSSDRVLDGLIAKLGQGGGAAAKVARDLAVLKTAITTLVETVSGVQDVKACTAAFRSA